MFNTLTTDGLEESQDRLGGFSLKDTDIYQATIKAFYAGKSDKGALNITLIADIAGSEYRETVYITNKEGKNYFMNKDDNTKKVPLPGFTIINDICLIAAGKPLSDMTTEEKVVKVWDSEAKKELPKSVEMVVEMIGTKVALGIMKQQVNKNVKDATGNYIPSADVREENVIDKVFHPEMKLTVAEAINGKEEAVFWDKWVEKNKGKVIDKRKVKDGQAGVANRPVPTAQAPAQRQSIFGKK